MNSPAPSLAPPRHALLDPLRAPSEPMTEAPAHRTAQLPADPAGRLWYAAKAAENGWSRKILEARSRPTFADARTARSRPSSMPSPLRTRSSYATRSRTPTTSSSSTSPSRRLGGGLQRWTDPVRQERLARRLVPDARVRCARFRGTTKAEILDQLDIEGTVLDAIAEVEAFVARNPHGGTLLGKDAA